MKITREFNWSLSGSQDLSDQYHIVFGPTEEYQSIMHLLNVSTSN